ncbi:MAG: MerR family transcriptional regulator [Candidatus Nanopelagicales bacterium]|jgi:DNA-binding transcriptional MerR regulator
MLSDGRAANNHKSKRLIQDSLFDLDVEPIPEGTGYRGSVACQAAGISYRQLDYWARTGLIEPSIRNAAGSGSLRLYSFKDCLVLKVIKRLLDTGVSLSNIRLAIDHLRAQGVEDLARLTLISDGASVYECTSDDEVIDLVRGGQGVFGIAVGSVLREVEGALEEFPAEYLDGRLVLPENMIDELAQRRSQREQSA